MISGLFKLLEDDKRRRKHNPNSAQKTKRYYARRQQQISKKSTLNSDSENDDIMIGSLPNNQILYANSERIYSVQNTKNMKLKSCFGGSMDDKDDTAYVKATPEFRKQILCVCPSKEEHYKRKQNGLDCPLSCTNVINEYKATRMTLLREKCDKNGIDKRVEKTITRFDNEIRRSVIFSSTSTDNSTENVRKNRKLKKKIRRPGENDDNYGGSSTDNEAEDDSNQTFTSITTTTSSEQLEDTISGRYEEHFERSMENLDQIGGESDECLRTKDVSFNEVDVSGVDLNNRLTHISTKSNSDSQLERNSDFRKSLKCYNNQSNSLEQNLVPNNRKSTYDAKCLEILKELIHTERNYVDSLKCVVEDYLPEMQRKDIVHGLRGQKYAVFCNIEKIYDFHKHVFLLDLEKCFSNLSQIGNCFLKHEKTFDIYSLYNKNKPKSEELMLDYGSFFEEKRLSLGHSLNLSSLLLKPVQRLARYSLLLDKLLKACEMGSETYTSILNAKEMITFTLRHGDDLLVMDGIKNCDVNLNEQGKLLRQEEFLFIEENGKKASKRRIFLFEELILFSIPSKTNVNEFTCCNSMKMSDVGLTDYGDANKLIIWFRKYQFQKYTLQAYSPEVKTAWVNEITNILMRQAEQYKLTKQAELAACGILSQTRIPIQEEESDEDERTSNKKYCTY
ncbi:kalirin-like isoform X2 [Chrysoperla carnea]|uniref:kalirin-like isoform X2 n=1 Tax=Chrysoperla carnea TaxID=189513 RepID=UPI001D0957F4|nr:kalirin-like isoform X2 [Chrysoperla carnea]